MWTQLKLYRNLIIIVLIAVLGFTFYSLINTINKLNKEIEVAVNNNKAAFKEIELLKDCTLVYLFKIDLLKYFNDSINQKLDSVVKDNKIKTKNIKQLLYIHSQVSKKDTILLRDTIFKKDFKLDTLIVHPGYKLELNLDYPNKIVTNPSFDNELYIIFSNKKETIDPPKKFFLARLFQKKLIVVTVDVFNSNKYMQVKQNRFINIIK